MERTELDHLVVAANRLEEGVDWVEARLGARPVPGGRHVSMGTHNALLRLGARCYLEVIAIDPEAEPPGRPRWFALDEDGLRARLSRSPSLVTWVARSAGLAGACARVPDLGDILPMTRNALRWKISVPPGGGLAWDGMLPTAIQWEPGVDGVLRHPCDTLPESGCELRSLQLAHPQAARLVALFRELRIAGPVDLVTGPSTLAAHIRTPRGEVTLA